MWPNFFSDSRNISHYSTFRGPLMSKSIQTPGWPGVSALCLIRKYARTVQQSAICALAGAGRYGQELPRSVSLSSLSSPEGHLSIIQRPHWLASCPISPHCPCFVSSPALRSNESRGGRGWRYCYGAASPEISFNEGGCGLERSSRIYFGLIKSLRILRM